MCDSADNPSDETESLTDADLSDIECRTKLLVELGLQKVCRLQSFTDQLNAKILSSFQNFLVLISIELTLFIYFLGTGQVNLSSLFPCLLWIGNAIVGIILFTHFVWPKTYTDVEMFTETRYKILCETEGIDILKDHLDALKMMDNKNLQTHDRLLLDYQISLGLLISPLISFPISMFLIWMMTIL